jgi:hypothetical protein
LYELYKIKQGILRLCDDLIINEERLVSFIRSNKFDFYGQNSYIEKNYFCNNIDDLKVLKCDAWMYKYYLNHPNDFKDPQHNLHNMNLEKLKQFLIRPDLYGPSGTIFYMSNKACKVLIEHMEKINYNVFHFDEFTKSYPYTIEDCGVTFVMYYNNIPFINNPDFYDSKNAIAVHTNKYK